MNEAPRPPVAAPAAGGAGSGVRTCRRARFCAVRERRTRPDSSAPAAWPYPARLRFCHGDDLVC